jgi:DNA-binding winged helix-turn-helix (wHTH) protein
MLITLSTLRCASSAARWGDDPDAPRFVVTVPSKGYRFIADVCEESLAAG